MCLMLVSIRAKVELGVHYNNIEIIQIFYLVWNTLVKICYC